MANARVVPVIFKSSEPVYADIGANEIVAFQFTTGSVASPAGNMPHITAQEHDSINPGRKACLSYEPGDLVNACNNAMFAKTTEPAKGTITMPFSVQTAASWGYPTIGFNQVVYLNLQDTSGTASQVRVTMHNTTGL
jgi:hypothetical protein